MADVIEAAGLAAARQKAEAPISVIAPFTIGIGPSGSRTPMGNDMHSKYQETRPGGLAVTFVAC